MKVLKIVICLFAVICFGQSSIKKNLYQSTVDIYQNSYKSSGQIITEGENMLKVSNTDYDISKSYLYLFLGYYLKGNFNKSIFYAKKADSLFLKQHSLEGHFIASYYLSLSYHKSEILQKATQYMNEAEKTAKKLDNPHLMAVTLKLKAVSLENEKRFSEAILYRIHCNNYFQKNRKNFPQFIISEFAFVRCYLAFDYLMVGNLEEAKKQIAFFESNNDISKLSSEFNWRAEIYYVCKAMIAAKEKDKISAADYFDKALDIARKSEMNARLTILLEQRLKLNIDTSEKREVLFAEFAQRKDHSEKENIKVIDGEINTQSINLEHEKEYKFVFILAGILLSAGIVIFKRKKRQKQKKYFEDIIQNLENKKTENLNVLKSQINNNQINIPDDCQDSSLALLEETEVDLLKKLDVFEKGNAFTAKNFTLNNFVSILDTNTKYVNYILKEHRGKTFSEYINDLRIKYILEYLHSNPESLKYKLNHLSDVAGFSSHSYFTKIFTKKTKITPSKFISALKEKNRKFDEKNI